MDKETISFSCQINELKPCPFCGSNKISISTIDDERLRNTKYVAYASCENCDCEISTDWMENEEIAKNIIKERWNRRAYNGR